MKAGTATPPTIGIAMSGEVTGFLHIVRVEAPVDPVTAEYRIAFAPVGGRLRSRHVMVQGLDRLTAFLRQAHVPTPDIERAWRALATRRIHSIPRVGLTPAQWSRVPCGLIMASADQHGLQPPSPTGRARLPRSSRTDASRRYGSAHRPD
jgi:hypothetical protein